MAVGYNESILRSTDNALSFSTVTSGISVHFEGLAIGNDVFVGGGNSGNIVRSTDNGASWDNVTSPTNNNFRDVIYY